MDLKTSHMLERYTKVLEWDNGYLVVMAKYKNNTIDEEEYINLIPILQNLYINTEEFLKPFIKVKIQTERRMNLYSSNKSLPAQSPIRVRDRSPIVLFCLTLPYPAISSSTHLTPENPSKNILTPLI